MDTIPMKSVSSFSGSLKIKRSWRNAIENKIRTFSFAKYSSNLDDVSTESDFENPRLKVFEPETVF